jgi:hypothetical protein
VPAGPGAHVRALRRAARAAHPPSARQEHIRQHLAPARRVMDAADVDLRRPAAGRPAPGAMVAASRVSRITRSVPARHSAAARAVAHARELRRHLRPAGPAVQLLLPLEPASSSSTTTMPVRMQLRRPSRPRPGRGSGARQCETARCSCLQVAGAQPMRRAPSTAGAARARTAAAAVHREVDEQRQVHARDDDEPGGACSSRRATKPQLPLCRSVKTMAGAVAQRSAHLLRQRLRRHAPVAHGHERVRLAAGDVRTASTMPSGMPPWPSSTPRTGAPLTHSPPRGTHAPAASSPSAAG